MWPWWEAPLPPPPPCRYAPTVCGPWLTGQDQKEQFIMRLRNTTSDVLIALGLMTLRVWHERDSGKAGEQIPQLLFVLCLGLCGMEGAENFGDFLKRESSKVIKSEERYPILVWKCEVPSSCSWSRYFHNDQRLKSVNYTWMLFAKLVLRWYSHDITSKQQQLHVYQTINQHIHKHYNLATKIIVVGNNTCMSECLRQKCKSKSELNTY